LALERILLGGILIRMSYAIWLLVSAIESVKALGVAVDGAFFGDYVKAPRSYPNLADSA